MVRRGKRNGPTDLAETEKYSISARQNIYQIIRPIWVEDPAVIQENALEQSRDL